MIRRGHLVAVVVRALLIGCTVFLMAGASGVQAEASQEEKQGHTEAAKEQGQSGGAAPEGGDRCDRTRTYDFQTKDPTIVLVFTTNDVPGCPKGGLLSGTDKRDLLDGKDGEDKVRGLGGPDNLYGGSGNDHLYGGPDGDYELIGGEGDDVLHGGDGDDAFESVEKSKSALADGDDVLYGGSGDDALFANKGEGKDVLYGGDGNDHLYAVDGQRDKLYCGKGTDTYEADTSDYVDSSCQKEKLVGTGGPPLLLLAGAALCSALMMLRYLIRSA